MSVTSETRPGFMRSLCLGQIDEELILPFPVLGDDQRELVASTIDSLRPLLAPHEEDFRRWDREGELPPEFLEEMKSFGLFSFVIPEEHGGMELGAAAYSRVMQELARHDASIAVTVGAHSSIGMRGLLLFGTEEQRARFYPKLATGEMVAAFCLTEPGAGSDAAAVKTTAVRDGDDWVLNGSKLWVTNGGIAQFFTVFAKTGDPGKRGHMTAFIVTRDMPGVSVGQHEDKMGLRASSTTSVYFDDVRVPDSMRLGEVGKGFKVAMKILNAGRTGLGGGSVGAMKALIERATRQAKERRQFDRSISEFGLVKQKVGHMVVECYAAESVVGMVAGMIDRGLEDYSVEAAISKVFATECLWRTADEALQIAGGNGYMCELPYERIVRDCRIYRIFEGTNDILRLFIALNAMNDVGDQLKELAAGMKGVFNDPIKGFGLLREYAFKQVSLTTGIAKSRFTRLSPALREPAEIFEEAARQLAAATDRILRKHGKRVVERQLATKRLADIMIDLFVLACALSRVDGSIVARGEQAAAREVDILRVLAGQARNRVRRNFAKIDDNDDELIKALADEAFEKERFGWDTI